MKNMMALSFNTIKQFTQKYHKILLKHFVSIFVKKNEGIHAEPKKRNVRQEGFLKMLQRKLFFPSHGEDKAD